MFIYLLALYIFLICHVDFCSHLFCRVVYFCHRGPGAPGTDVIESGKQVRVWEMKVYDSQNLMCACAALNTEKLRSSTSQFICSCLSCIISAGALSLQ